MSEYDYWDIGSGQPVSEQELLSRFQDFLDETNYTVNVAGIEMQPSTVLRRTDPIAYRVAWNDWLDSELGQSITDTEPADEDEKA